MRRRQREVLNLRYLAWNAPNISSGFRPVERRRGPDVMLEEAREVGLIRKPRLGRNRRQGLVATGQLRSRPGQSKTPTVLADRAPVAGSESAGQVRRMHTDRCGQLGQANAVADACAEQLFGRAQPGLSSAGMPHGSGLAGAHREQLQSKPFSREWRGRIGCAQLSGKSPREPAEPAIPKLDKPVETASGEARLALRPHDDD